MNNIGVDRVRTDNFFNFKYKFDDESTENNQTATIYNNIGHTCDYVDLNEFQEKVSELHKQISFYSSNIRSLPGKALITISLN